MRAVEDADHAPAPGSALRIRQRKSCCRSSGVGALNGGDPHALRVDRPDDVPHDPALAGGVHALDDEQHACDRAALARAANSRSCSSESRSRARRRAPPRPPACRRRSPGVDRGSTSASRTRAGPQQVGQPLRSRRVDFDSASPAALGLLDQRLAFDAALAAFFALAIRIMHRRRPVSRCGGGRRRCQGEAMHRFAVWAPRASPSTSSCPDGSDRATGDDPRRATAGGASTSTRPGTAPTTRFRLDGGAPAARPAQRLAAARRARPEPGVRPAPVRLDATPAGRGRRRARRGLLRAARRHVHAGGHPGRRRRAARPPASTSASTSSSSCRSPRSRALGLGLRRGRPLRGARAVRRPGGAAAVRRRRHGAGLGVCLDVVYNHLGPCGQLPGRVRPVLHRRAPHALGRRGQPRRRRARDEVRRWIIDNALRWFARLPRRRAAPGRRARARRRLAAGTCSPSCRDEDGRAGRAARAAAVAGRRERPERPADGRADRRAAASA